MDLIQEHIKVGISPAYVWYAVPGNGKWYLPEVEADWESVLTTTNFERLADDFSVFSSSVKDHTAALQTIATL